MANFQAPCPAPTVINGRQPSTCIEGDPILHNSQCTPLCAVYYATTDPVMSCANGILTPNSFNCTLVRYVPPRWPGTTPSPTPPTTTDPSQWTEQDHWAAITCGVLIAVVVACSFLVVVRAVCRTKTKGKSRVPQDYDWDEDAYNYGVEAYEPEPVARPQKGIRAQLKAAAPPTPVPVPKPAAPPTQTAIGAATPAKKAAPAPKQVKPKPAPAPSPKPAPPEDVDPDRDRHGHYDLFG